MDSHHAEVDNFLSKTKGRRKKSLGVESGVSHCSCRTEDISARDVSQLAKRRPFLIKSHEVSSSESAGRCPQESGNSCVCPERAMEPSAARSSSWCPRELFEHLACWCCAGKQKILQDSVFGAWGCASMIHSVSELQINTFRLLYGKIAGSLLAFLQTLFPEAVSYSLCPWNSTASSAPATKTWDAWNQ